MPSYDEHLRRLKGELSGLLRDRIVEATSLSRDGRAIGMERWEEYDPKEPARRARVMAVDEGGCQLYMKFPPKTRTTTVHWGSLKRVPFLHLSEPQLLALKRYVWYPNDPKCPLVVLVRCAK